MKNNNVELSRQIIDLAAKKVAEKIREFTEASMNFDYSDFINQFKIQTSMLYDDVDGYIRQREDADVFFRLEQLTKSICFMKSGNEPDRWLLALKELTQCLDASVRKLANNKCMNTSIFLGIFEIRGMCVRRINDIKESRKKPYTAAEKYTLFKCKCRKCHIVKTVYTSDCDSETVNVIYTCETCKEADRKLREMEE